MIRSHIASLIKKDIPNPSNGVANASASSATSNTTQVTMLTLVLKSFQDPGKRDDLAIRILLWRKEYWRIFKSQELFQISTSAK